MGHDHEPGLTPLDELRAASVLDEGGASAVEAEHRLRDALDDCSERTYGATLGFVAGVALMLAVFLARPRRRSV